MGGEQVLVARLLLGLLVDEWAASARSSEQCPVKEQIAIHCLLECSLKGPVDCSMFVLDCSMTNRKEHFRVMPCEGPETTLDA